MNIYEDMILLGQWKGWRTIVIGVAWVVAWVSLESNLPCWDLPRFFSSDMTEIMAWFWRGCVVCSSQWENMGSIMRPCYFHRRNTLHYDTFRYRKRWRSDWWPVKDHSKACKLSGILLESGCWWLEHDFTFFPGIDFIIPIDSYFSKGYWYTINHEIHELICFTRSRHHGMVFRPEDEVSHRSWSGSGSVIGQT